VELFLLIFLAACSVASHNLYQASGMYTVHIRCDTETEIFLQIDNSGSSVLTTLRGGLVTRDSF
jgi:hypothetical protein